MEELNELRLLMVEGLKLKTGGFDFWEGLVGENDTDKKEKEERETERETIETW